MERGDEPSSMQKDDEFIALLLLNQPALPDISISLTLQETKTLMVLLILVGTKVVVISIIKLNVIIGACTCM